MRIGALAFFGAIILLTVPIPGCAASVQHIDFFEPTHQVDRNIHYPVQGCAPELEMKPEGISLDVKHQNQQVDYAPIGQSNLCWATDSAMISTYLGNPRVPCQIASYKADTGLSCCRLTRQSPQTDIDRCNQGGDPGLVLNRMGIYNIYKESILSEDQVRHQLANGRPVMLHTELDSVENGKKVKAYHVVLITGYKDGKYHVLNSSRDSTSSLTYDQMQNGDHQKWKWIGTWYHFSFRSDGCNPRFRPDCDVCR